MRRKFKVFSHACIWTGSNCIHLLTLVYISKLVCYSKECYKMGTNKGKGCESQFSQIFWHRLILRGQADNLNEIPPPKKGFLPKYLAPLLQGCTGLPSGTVLHGANLCNSHALLCNMYCIHVLFVSQIKATDDKIISMWWRVLLI